MRHKMDIIGVVSSRICFFGAFVSLTRGLGLRKCGPDLFCKEELYCCESASYFCCDHATFINHTSENDPQDISEDSFIRMGLKSALVLLILSSAIFLLCFCIMRCCQRASLRSSNMPHGGSLADFRRPHGRMDSLSTRLSTRTLRLLSLTVTHSSANGNDDEPPTYSQIFQPGTTSDVQVEIENDKPPPEYDTIMKEEGGFERS